MTKQRKRIRTRSLVVICGVVALAVHVVPSEAQLSAPSCPVTSTTTTWNGAFLDTDTTKDGVTFNGSSSKLELSKRAEEFSTKQMTSTSDTVYAAVADFNQDGWDDFVGAPQNAITPMNVFRNFTWELENCTDATCTSHAGSACTVCAANSPPDFTNPAIVVEPKFTIVRTLGSFPAGRFSLAAGDFNGDTWPDVFTASAPDTSTDQITSATLFLNAGVNDGSGNPQFGAGYTANAFTPLSDALGPMLQSGTNTKVVDFNKDGKLDVLVGTTKANGSIRVLLNNCPGTVQSNGVVLCSANPQFTDGGYLISDLNIGNDGFGNVVGSLPVFDYADIDLDGLADLVVGSPNCCTDASFRARLYKGCSGGAGCTAGLENVASQSLPFSGAASAIFIADFSLDGKPDLVLATDGKNFAPSQNGGSTFYFRNNGTSTPFGDGLTEQLTFKGTVAPQVDDFDVGIVFDYDNDPRATPDIMVANGNDANGYNVIADRISALFVDCGEVVSGEIDLGSLSDDEIVVTAARITPTFEGSGTVTFYMSNEDPVNFVQANLCTASTTDYCASFPKPAGRTVRWKAVLCTASPFTESPSISGVSAKFDYTKAKEFYRAGTIVSDGIVYVGAFLQPGERGRFYALDAALTQIYWDAGSKLDAQADTNRKIYTAAANLAVRIPFETSQASDPLLQNVLQTADATSTSELISWVRDARFGLGTGAAPKTKLGSVENSTPAILTAPGRPTWYSFVTSAERTRIDAFITENTTRKPLVLFGSKDGMIHALHTRPTETPANSINGTEAWAFIPPTVASGMLADRVATLAATAASGANDPTIASYPDGSPTLVDVHVGGGVFKTLAAVAEGNGGRSFTVLDVTQTVDPATDSIIGPTPMWSATPGDGEAGQAFAKPVVARVVIANAERYLVIAATGIDFNDTLDEKGRIVSAYDALTGELMWKFQTKCPVTSHIATFETDDTGEAGAPTLNGFTDRVVFADKCGYLYKLAPAVDLDGAFYENTDTGSILANTTADGKKQYAIFSTKTTTGALGQDRPIAGTLAARTDNSTRMVLFFGTGGLEQVSASATNEFYAVYADTGEIRSKLTGACTANGCEKFYGGIIVTAEQVIFTKTIDPAVGASSCDFGSTTVSFVPLNADASGDFAAGTDLAITSAVMGSLYGDAGAIYFATLAGEVARIGTPRAPSAGGDTAAGVTQGMGVGDQGADGAQIGTTEAFTLVGWRIVL
jgi:hypothetical protein